MSDQQDVLAAANRLCQAFGEGRIKDYFACFLPNADFMFHGMPTRIESRAEYERWWGAWEKEIDLKILGCRSFDQHVNLMGNVALYTHSVDVDVSTNQGIEHRHERETIVFLKQPDGRWMAAHEHLSKAPSA